jgi:D-alanine-D-alanine ligase
MATKLRVGVIFGGRSAEHEVSLVTAASVIRALDRTKYDIVPIGIAKNGKWLSSSRTLDQLRSGANIELEDEHILLPDPRIKALANIEESRDAQPLDVVIPLIHGRYGEDGTLQGLLEMADLPYVGSGVLGSALGLDKVAQKGMFAAAGLPICPYTWFTTTEWSADHEALIGRIEGTLDYPRFIKPANTGSSIGITKAHTRFELLEGINEALGYDRKIVVEQGVRDAREIECAVLGNDAPEASVLGEIVASNEFYDYDAKYVDGQSTAIIPALLSPELTERVRMMAIEAFRSLDCAGMARVDFFVQKGTDAIYLNEINTIPGFTSISMYPKLWEASGLAYGALLDKLISLALDRHADMKMLHTEYKPKREWYRG